MKNTPLDRRSIVAIGFCVLFFIGYEYYLNQKYPNRHKQVATEPVSHVPSSEEQVEVAPRSAKSAAAKKLTEVVQQPIVDELSGDDLVLENNQVRLRFSQEGGSLQSVVLKSYLSDDRSEVMELLDSPLHVQGQLGALDHLDRSMFRAVRSDSSLTFQRLYDNWEISESYTLDPEGYGARIEVRWKNLAEFGRELTSAVLFSEVLGYPKSGGMFSAGVPNAKPTFLLGYAEKKEWTDIESYCTDDKADPILLNNEQVDVLGFDRHYFSTLFLPNFKKSNLFVQKSDFNEASRSCRLSARMLVNQGRVSTGQEVTLSFGAWLGPKVGDLMEAYSPKLQDAIDLGIFAIVSKPLFWAMDELHNVLGNWGLAIIVLTLLIKLLFYPLTRQAAIAQNRMKKLQPEMAKIKERYKNDMQKQQQETMMFMKKHNVNPMKGCLPILPQMPIFIAFYRLLSTSIELRHAPFFAWIQDLSELDPWYITPVLLGVTMFLQQRFMPTAGMDKAQERIMMFVPLVFSLVMLTLPAGLVLYMLTNTIVSIFQQQWLNRRLATS